MNSVRNLMVSLGVSGVLFAQNAMAFDDPFTHYLSSIPAVIRVISDTNTGTGTTAITTKRFTFGSRSDINTVFAVMAFPQAAGKYPGILFLHGGGGNAETMAGNVVSYAQKGYAAIAIDQPGICGTTNTPYTLGPWKSRPLGEGPRFDVAAGPQNSTLVDAEVAGLEAFNYLRGQAFTDTTRMGITGSSWGGYSTTFLAGLLGAKIEAAWAYLGCGFYDKGSFWKPMLDTMNATTKNTWLTFLDAGRRASNIKAPYFLEAASNDTYFWPEAVTATLDAVPGTKNHLWAPNLNHQGLTSPGKQVFFDYYLKGLGNPLASINISAVGAQLDGSKKILLSVTLPPGVAADSVKVYYSVPDTTWQGRTWIALNAKLESGTTYSLMLAPDLVLKKVDFYAMLKDTRGIFASSMMYNASSNVTATGDGAKGSSCLKTAAALSVSYSGGTIAINNFSVTPQIRILEHVFAIDGKLIAQQNSSSAIIHIPLCRGVYFVRIEDGSRNAWIGKLAVTK